MTARSNRRRVSISFDRLETREVLSTSPVGPLAPLPSDVSGDLRSLYQVFTGNDNSVSPDQFPTLRVVDNYVGIDVKVQGNLGSEVTSLQNLGMNVTAVGAANNLVEGYLPISALPTAAQLPGTFSVVPNYIPRQFALSPPGTPSSNVSGDLSTLYQVFTGNNNSVSPDRFPTLRIVAGYVGIDIKAQGGLGPEVTSLQNLGMNVTAVGAANNLVEGYLPISALPTAAQLPGTFSVVPNYIPRQFALSPPGTPNSNVSGDLSTLYQVFTGNNGNVTPAQFPSLRIVAGYVGVDIKAQGGLGPEVISLQNLGMNVTAVGAANDLVEGYLPISALPTAAQLPGTSSIVPDYIPRLFATSIR